MRPRRTAVEVDEAVLPQPCPLPHAEGRIHFDRSRREAVLKRGHIDYRLKRGTRLAQRLDSAVVAGADYVEPALHRHHPARVNLFDQHSARDFGNRAKRIIGAPDLLDDDHLAWLKEVERPAPDSAFGDGGIRRVEDPRRPIRETDTGLGIALAQDDSLSPVGVAGS